MSFDAQTRHGLLTERAAEWIDLAIDNIEREYPYMPWMVVEGPGALPSHRDLHPTFFGSFDWHSCVEMYWVAVRLMRLVPGTAAETRARSVISTLLTDDHIAVEQAFFTAPATRNFERPYGWGWLLALQSELDGWDDAHGQRWATTLRPLAETISASFVSWLPLLTYPQRVGMHANTAFALLRSLPFAVTQAAGGDASLRDAIHEAAGRFYLADEDYPARYEPSGADFLSAALTEAELMSQILTPETFVTWLDSFLPGLASEEPPQLFTPAIVSDGSDGQIAHLAGLNLSRSASFLGIAAALPLDDDRVASLEEAARVHADAALDSVSGSHYMLEHWLAAYATLLLTV
jgi:hypothetical protein